MKKSSSEAVLFEEAVPVRKRGQKRYLTLLAAAVNLLKKSGIRGLRHRALAAEAGVPLSATTYYFAGLEELKRKTFSYYLGTVCYDYQQSLFSAFSEVVQNYQNEQKTEGCNPDLDDFMLQLAKRYIVLRASFHEQHPEFDRVYQLLCTEALWDSQVQANLDAYRRATLEGYQHICDAFGLQHPDDAQMLMCFIDGLNCEQKTTDQSQANQYSVIEKSLHRFLNLLRWEAQLEG